MFYWERWRQDWRPGHHPAGIGFYGQATGCNCRSITTTHPSKRKDESWDKAKSKTLFMSGHTIAKAPLIPQKGEYKQCTIRPLQQTTLIPDKSCLEVQCLVSHLGNSGSRRTRGSHSAPLQFVVALNESYQMKNLSHRMKWVTPNWSFFFGVSLIVLLFYYWGHACTF